MTMSIMIIIERMMICRRRMGECEIIVKRGSLEYHCLLTSAKALGKGPCTFQYNLYNLYNVVSIMHSTYISGCFRTGYRDDDKEADDDDDDDDYEEQKLIEWS